MKRFTKTYILIVFSLFSTAVVSQPTDSYALKAAFMLKMMRFIDWPKSALDEGSDFTICIAVSENEFGDLKDWSKSGSIKSRTVIVQHVNGDAAKLSSCNILYFTSNRNIDTYLEFARSNSFLTISDIPGNAGKGVIVNFNNVKGKLRFEINLDEARQNGFRFDSRLLKLATIVSGEGGKQ